MWDKDASRKLHGILSEFWRGLDRGLDHVDWHDIENNVASEVHVKRFRSKEVGIKKLQVKGEGHA